MEREARAREEQQRAARVREEQQREEQAREEQHRAARAHMEQQRAARALEEHQQREQQEAFQREARARAVNPGTPLHTRTPAWASRSRSCLTCTTRLKAAHQVEAVGPAEVEAAGLAVTTDRWTCALRRTGAWTSGGRPVILK